LADALDGAVKGGEEAAPDAEVAAEDGGAHLDGRDGADAALAEGRVSEALDAVPDGAADGLGGELSAGESRNGERGEQLCRGGAFGEAWLEGCGRCWLRTHAHAKGAAKVIEDDQRTGISAVIHGDGWAVGRSDGRAVGCSSGRGALEEGRGAGCRIDDGRRGSRVAVAGWRGVE
jgi:hypothetical protein